jgi:hypothetical protein
MDLPMERILGMSANMGSGGGRSNGVSHWGAWQIDEDTIKMHIEPMLDVVCTAITKTYLRPLSKDELAAVSYDTSALRLRPDRSKESIELYNLGLVSGDVVMKENGFDPTTDAMTPEEQRTWLLVKLATGSATPDMVANALGQLGVNVPALGSVLDINQARPAPSLESHPERPATPDPEESEAASLLHACEGLVFRALERAGNRIRQQGVKPPGLRSFEVHTAIHLSPTQAQEALTDAWSCAPQVLDGIADDVEQVVGGLNAYATGLLVRAEPHTRDALAKWLTMVPA